MQMQMEMQPAIGEYLPDRSSSEEKVQARRVHSLHP